MALIFSLIIITNSYIFWIYSIKKHKNAELLSVLPSRVCLPYYRGEKIMVSLQCFFFIFLIPNKPLSCGRSKGKKEKKELWCEKWWCECLSCASQRNFCYLNRQTCRSSSSGLQFTLQLVRHFNTKRLDLKLQNLTLIDEQSEIQRFRQNLAAGSLSRSQDLRVCY